MKKIVIIGPEATGKSTLCTGLAAHYGTQWVPEFAREYLLQNGNGYGFENLLTIAQGQQALEDAHASALQQASAGSAAAPETNPAPLFIDTNQYVMKVWCEVVFGNCHPWILKQAANARYDLYLLCNVDLPWVQDGLRRNPDFEMRRCLFLAYKDILVNDGTPWGLVSGTGADRLQNAVDIVNQYLKP